MSLFDSIYDGADEAPADPAPDRAPEPVAPAPRAAEDASPFAAVDGPADDGVTASPVGAPTPAPPPPASDAAGSPPLEIAFDDGSGLSLQDFAAEVFGGDGQPATGVDSGAPAEGAPAPPQPATSSFSAFAELEAAAEAVATPATATATATLDDPVPPTQAGEEIEPAAGGSLAAEHDAPGSGTESEDSTPALASEAPGFDEAFSTLLHLDDDLLPARKPKRGGGFDLSVLSGPVSNLTAPLRIGLILVVVAALGFGSARLLGGGGSTSPAPDAAAAAAVPAQLGDLPVSGALDPRNAGAVIGAAELVAVEADLRVAAVQAQAHFAETGSFALSPAEWGERLGRTVVAAGNAPSVGVLQVLSDGTAVCFETAVVGGLSAAVAVTADGAQTFASDEAGGALCTLDAATLGGWQPSLVTL